jgi:3-methyladenine DNA glycosylase AlkD
MTSTKSNLADLRADIKKRSNKNDARFAQRFFKTGPGEYGEGDVFLGIRVPVLRKLARQYRGLPEKDVLTLLASTYHEERLLALFILCLWFEKGDEKTRDRIYRIYVKNTRWINNWDLVDTTAHKIVGPYLEHRSKKPLRDLAGSRSLWERRIAVLSTFHFIRQGDVRESLKIATMLLKDEEDLMHKAVGWMLREVGKKDLAAEEAFLKDHYRNMPRTMLRYAIEKFPEAKRQRYLKGRV